MNEDPGETLDRLVQELVDAIGEAGSVMDEAMDVARAATADGPAGTTADGVTSGP